MRRGSARSVQGINCRIPSLILGQGHPGFRVASYHYCHRHDLPNLLALPTSSRSVDRNALVFYPTTCTTVSSLLLMTPEDSRCDEVKNPLRYDTSQVKHVELYTSDYT